MRHGAPALRDGPSDCFAALRGHNFVRPDEEAAAGIYSGMAAVGAGAAVGRRNSAKEARDRHLAVICIILYYGTFY